jgi:hypothetical protein
MTVHAVAAAQSGWCISVSYDATGLANASLYDNRILGWVVDDAGVIASVPVILGTMPPAAPATAPVLSPQWAQAGAAGVGVPNAWRGSLTDFFTWLATNHGAARKLQAFFLNADLARAFAAWRTSNPALAL